MITFSFATIGVMSGTSLDGIDLVYSVLYKEDIWSFKIVYGETVPYPTVWKSRLQKAHRYTKSDLKILNQEYTQFLGEVISAFIERRKITNLVAVCSHGHTILHQPAQGITLQIGNLKELATIIGHKVICDFRIQDVELGGQGAPLVPIGDQLLFSEYTSCVNLGGFANISRQIENKRIAYDICPVNIVLNKVVEKLGLAYDDSGRIAEAGHLIPALLLELDALPFYHKKPPKSLGLEWVEQRIFPLLRKYDTATVPDLLHTFCIHVAKQIASQFHTIGTAKVLFTGGGVYHKFLIRKITENTAATIVIPSNSVIEYKEALIFSLLGILRLQGIPNCLKSVTGASRDHSSGMIYEP